MRTYRPSTSRRRAGLALFPASLLPYKEQWQQIANGLPDRAILIILPAGENPPRKTLETVASLLEAAGHRVTTMPANQFA